MYDYPWWTDEQRQLMVEVEKLVDEVLEPMAERCVRRREFPWEPLRLVADKGWLGAAIPKEYGGRAEEMGLTGVVILSEAMSRAGTLATAFSTTVYAGSMQILHHGTDEQKRHWLPKFAKGELYGCITMTEPYAGSDIAEIETTAVRDGDEYVLNGIKRFQTVAGAADVYMSYAKTSEDPADRKAYRHLTGLLVEKGMPGFTIERFNDWMGTEGMYNVYLRFDDVRVPAANVIGSEGDGWKVMMSGLNPERVINAATYLGGVREAIRYARMHLERRVQFRQPTGDIASNQQKLADLYWKYYVMRLLTYYTAHCFDQGRDVPIDGAIAKLVGSDYTFEIASDAIQLMGGNGVMKHYPVHRALTDAKLCQISAGTNEIMRLVIYRMGGSWLADGLKAPVLVWDDELQAPVPTGKPPERRHVSDAMSVLEVLAENYRVNPGLHMTLDDIKVFLDVDDGELLAYLESLEERGLASQWRDRKGRVGLVKATLEGVKKAFPIDHFRQIPDWVGAEDVF
jgi:alkylation response protein AidB-like acyl-CoA dehydrogenase